MQRILTVEDLAFMWRIRYPREYQKRRVTRILHAIFEGGTITPPFCITDTGGTYSE
jgi:hypothetical protein